MEVALELEDDLFFADLSKQISLLIMDEEDEHPLASSPQEHHFQVFFTLILDKFISFHARLSRKTPQNLKFCSFISDLLFFWVILSPSTIWYSV